MNIVTTLEQSGLEPKQAQVYYALLQLGTASASSIAKKALLKRPTTYLIIDELVSKGLISTVPQARKALFTCMPPEKLLVDLKKREKLLIQAMPELTALQNNKIEKPAVQFFQGVEGVKEVYEQIYASGEVCFFATLGDLEREIPDVPAHVAKLAYEKKLKVREILSGTEADKRQVARKPDSEFYKIKIAPDGKGFFTDNAIYGKKVAFFSFKPMLYAVTIESAHIQGSLKSLFEIAWGAC